jgi:two-component sensor histidine kinase
MDSWLGRLHQVLPQSKSFGSWIWGFGILAAAICLKLLLDGIGHGAQPPFITFYPAIVAISLVCGTTVGLAAVIIATGTAWVLWMSPTAASTAMPLASIVTIVAFVCFGSFVALVVGLTRQLLDEHVAHAAERSHIARETVHRIKNLLAVVQAISQKILRQSDNLPDYSAKFVSRLGALASAQDVLLRSEWQDVDVGALVEQALAPFRPNPALQIVGGEPLLLPAAYANHMSMALYELATNAMKYGALYARSGAVTLMWRSSNGNGVIEWRERSSEPPVGAISASGTGASLVKTALGLAHGTKVDYQVAANAVDVIFQWPLTAERKDHPRSSVLKNWRTGKLF